MKLHFVEKMENSALLLIFLDLIIRDFNLFILKVPFFWKRHLLEENEGGMETFLLVGNSQMFESPILFTWRSIEAWNCIRRNFDSSNVDLTNYLSGFGPLINVVRGWTKGKCIWKLSDGKWLQCSLDALYFFFYKHIQI